MNLNFFVRTGFGLLILCSLTFGVLQWFHISAGNFLDWVIGAASFFWLLVIVTVPWDIYFQAKKVLAEAALSEERNIQVDEKKIRYVKDLENKSLLVAISLHIISSLALYALAATGISAVGYISSGAALLLTALRPAISAYEYLYARLGMILNECKYPREDILELRSRFGALEDTVNIMHEQLDPTKTYSLVTKQETFLEETRTELARISAKIEKLRATNEQEHEELAKNAKQAIAQLSEDGQFLQNAREVIRFFKEA
ncbi:MAG: hypothetical protein AAF378_12165 [Cyanobacteria bacterium P01_A01_bin.84]